jgi:glycosyltransferase involved in cell wall biosynthesis
MVFNYKIAHISLDDFSGAGKAALRICQSQRNSGLDAILYVLNKKTEYPFVKLLHKSKFRTFFYKIFERLFLKIFLINKQSQFSLGKISILSSLRLFKNYDIINLHWINSGLLSNYSIRFLIRNKKHVFWTIHDMWPFTGGCHYSSSCKGFESNCNNCPLIFKHATFLPMNNLISKQKSLFKNIVTISPSNWMHLNVSTSSLFKNSKNYIIHNPVDHDIFNLQKDHKIKLDHFNILFGSYNYSTDSRKGFNYFFQAIKFIKTNNFELFSKIIIHLFGSKDSISELTSLGIKVVNHGKIEKDEILADLYNLADVFVAPSVEENLANTVNESIACGTPVVAFNVGGMPDLIDHRINGYLAIPYQFKDLCYGIEWVYNNYSNINFQVNCEIKSQKSFTRNKISNDYLKVYNEIIHNLI